VARPAVQSSTIRRAGAVNVGNDSLGFVLTPCLPSYPPPPAQAHSNVCTEATSPPLPATLVNRKPQTLNTGALNLGSICHCVHCTPAWTLNISACLAHSLSLTRRVSVLTPPQPVCSLAEKVP
jgi:hypothetical protein